MVTDNPCFRSAVVKTYRSDRTGGIHVPGSNREFEQEVEYAIASTRFSSRSRAGDDRRNGGGANNNAFRTHNNTLNKGPRGLRQRQYQHCQNIQEINDLSGINSGKKSR
ncbi:hypothetical protein TSTA_023390 [Talaromyces stipitatus ATCC 10500]|uniref:Uncharacterized protein n=1 Tax=Talaromyces stipitatus (strain ATCC 10500 / CBS 375.48 / QM 6759 / NRRL 1006) TaxID=441959 RepID=B8M604_TALSN|nr:uncharacterized protein TSTA_023390 [Talaromyces stipitatus ATCC 10500]EED19004.1 hypothetical protein TSTA_023390 [Talaromyces stipitatus ATCC 10500]